MIQNNSKMMILAIFAMISLIGMTEQHAFATVGTPTASPVGGLFNSAQVVTLTSSDGINQIQYTTDGSDPTLGGTLVASGSTVNISSTTTLKFAETDGSIFSSIITEVYTIDTIAPTLTAVSITSNNANTAFAKTGDLITLTFTASETIQTPTVTILGHSVSASNTGGNDWSAQYTTVSGDSEGVIPFTIDFSDIATNAGTQVTGTTDSSSVTFDKTPPNISITSPIDASTSGTAIIHVTGTASDTNLATVEVSVNGGAYVTAIGTTSWTYDTSSLSDGPYTIDARATDSAGNTQSATQIHVTVDTANPTVTISSPTDNSFTNNAVVHVVGTATDGSTGISKVEISVDGGAFSLASTSDGYANWTFDTSSLSEGAHTLDAKVTGVNSLTATSSTVHVTVDLTPPTISITSPTDASTVSTASIHVTGTASDTNLATVEVSVNGGAYVTATGTTSWTYDTSSLSNGVYTIDARATDSAGNTQDATQINVTVDSTSPLVTITSPLDGDVLTNALSFNVNGTASDGLLGISLVEVSVNGSAYSPATTHDNFAHWGFVGSISGDGSFTITARVTGVNSLTGTDTITVSENTVVYHPIGGYAGAVPSQSVPSVGFTGNHIFHDGLTINGNVFDLSKNNVEIPKQSLEVGKYVTIKVKEMPLYGSFYWQHIGFYMGFGTSDPQPANAMIQIEDDKTKGSMISDTNGYLANAVISSAQTDEKTVLHTIQFKVVKPMPDSQIVLRLWDNRMHSVDIHVQGAVQLGLDAPIVTKTNPNEVTYTSMVELSKWLDSKYFEKPQMLRNIHDSNALFGNTGGKISWTVNTATNTITANAVDRDGKLVWNPTEKLVEVPLHPRGVFSTTEDHVGTSYAPSWINSGAYGANAFKMPAGMN